MSNKKIKIEDTPRDKEIEKRLVSMMKENPTGLIIYFLCICGREMESSNAETMDINTEATFNKKRYKVSGKITIKKLKPATPPNQ